jgi:hypothetical protein
VRAADVASVRRAVAARRKRCTSDAKAELKSAQAAAKAAHDATNKH